MYVFEGSGTLCFLQYDNSDHFLILLRNWDNGYNALYQHNIISADAQDYVLWFGYHNSQIKLSRIDLKKVFEKNLLKTELFELNVRNWSSLTVAMQMKQWRTICRK